MCILNHRIVFLFQFGYRGVRSLFCKIYRNLGSHQLSGTSKTHGFFAYQLPPSRKINGKEISKTYMIWSQNSTQIPIKELKYLDI